MTPEQIRQRFGTTAHPNGYLPLVVIALEAAQAEELRLRVLLVKAECEIKRLENLLPDYNQ